ncbi:hypothetical protein B0T24DRAFT_661257 [Lasiosphaeria ovina]|uniref:Tyrosinase C-terminal domain-containing protein n=1 Tax=Lasiosphaeria ovina TaxID=92902 RepID=A0AAE0TWY4_9PEZI|nr:hypothetical protein B0T24DRAFT_661257 [Lasiosphaeria ovina]
MQADESIVEWYEVAGIHGWPQAIWDKAPQENWKEVRKNTWDLVTKDYNDGTGGYCAHGVHIFGPYQTLYRTMAEIVADYTDSVMRRHLYSPDGSETTTKFPWDFRLPDIFMEKKVTIRRAPDNKPEPVDNPLTLMICKFTTIATDATHPLAEGDLTGEATTRTDGFTNREFVLDVGNGRESLEALHNMYHNFIGGGHMGDTAVAAFDPLAAHPKKWFPKPSPSEETQTDEGKRPLLPFYKVHGHVEQAKTYWTSDEVRHTTSLGYVYDDFDQLPNPDLESVGNYVQAKYQWVSSLPKAIGVTDPPDDFRPIYEKVHATYCVVADRFPLESMSIMSTSALVSDAAEPLLPPPENKMMAKFDREWYVDSQVKRMAQNGPFTVYFFLTLHGEIPHDPQNYSVSPYIAGLHYIFAARVEGCDSCARADAAGDLSHNDIKDARAVPDLKIGLSAKISHDEGGPTYEEDPDVVSDIILGASRTATVTA